MRFVSALLLLTVLSANGIEAADASGLRRLYDFTPVSATNPIVASVSECGIEIPVSEFRAHALSIFSAAEQRRPGPLSPAEKRRCLDELLDDHFLLWDGYQRKADQTKEIAEMLKATEALLLQEALTKREVDDQAKTPEESGRLTRKLRDELFDRTDIVVSIEAWDQLKAALKQTNAAPAAVQGLPLARCKLGTITIGDVLALHAQLPADIRPDLRKQEGLSGSLKTILNDSLLVEEARARGLEKSAEVVETVQRNRNALTRMHAIDHLTGLTIARMKAPGQEERLRKWYQDHLSDRYTHTGAGGKTNVLSFEAERQSIENDYFEAVQEEVRAEAIRELRRGRSIQIDEKLLERLVVDVKRET